MARQQFLVAAGTIPGRDHVGRGDVLFGKNNQDANSWYREGDLAIGIVCDGCGSGLHSEVGAKIGARLILNAILRRVRRNFNAGTDETFLEGVRREVLSQIHAIALSMAGEGSVSEVIKDYFLFTIVGAAVSPAGGIVFHIGDGVAKIDTTFHHFQPKEGNEPPYLAYGITGVPAGMNENDLRFESIPFTEWEHILIASDGATKFMQSGGLRIPGTEDRVTLAEFTRDEKYIRNRDQIRRKLALLNREVVRADNLGRQHAETGTLADDTTILVIRRNSSEGETDEGSICG